MERIELLEGLASQVIGDGQTPNLYFVTVQGNVVLVTREFDQAYDYWRYLPRNVETSLEDRLIGCICTTEPIEDGSTQLVTHDDSRMVTA
jgi:hypothetical protein